MASISVVADTLTREKSQPSILECVSNFCFKFFSPETLDLKSPIFCKSHWFCSSFYCSFGFIGE